MEERIKRAIEEVQRLIDTGEHNCDVHVEDLGDMKEVSFYIDTDSLDSESTATLNITPMPDGGN